MKILTFTILASLALGATAAELPAMNTQTAPAYTVAYDGPNSDHREVRRVDVDTADTSDADRERDRDLNLDGTNEPSDRDLEADAERTYDQTENIESDYGDEIEKEIIEDRDLKHDHD